MSDAIKHECGVAFIRLLKPMEYYYEKYGTCFYGLDRLHALMLKMRNRGQDGAGIATIKINPSQGTRYISRKRSNSNNYLQDLFNDVYSRFNDVPKEILSNPVYLKENFPYMGELLLGHLRYGTHGDNTIETCHPFLRQSNWISRNLALAGNFNLTNVDELFDELVELGQYPKQKSDTVTVLEKIGHFLDDEVQRLHTWFKPEGPSTEEMNQLIFEHLDLQRLLRRASKKFDGGYVMAGMIGHGDAFVMRDPHGIRPAYYYQDDEVVVAASERPAIQTVFNVQFDKVHELSPGNALIIKKNGTIKETHFIEQSMRRACSFERIYFSRGTDKEIYQERKKLGALLAKPILNLINNDFENTVFSFVPNTAETAYMGLIEGLELELNEIKKKELIKHKDDLKPKRVTKILQRKVRNEKLIHKDIKQRTFITPDAARNSMVSQIYDVTYGIVRPGVDNVVLLDDSIVRGTTLRKSIITITARLKPKRIIIVSSAPQIRFPDCYGIDMSRMRDFVAFNAVIELLKENNKEHILDEVYEKAKLQEHLPKEQVKNVVTTLYQQFTYEQVSKKIAEIITPKDLDIEVSVIFQTIQGLHQACPDNNGDWYFSGIYPTPGGTKVCNKSFINYMEKSNARAYT